MKVLVTGFEPFDGRAVNASWIAAQGLTKYQALCLPVVWGEPPRLLREHCETDCPDVIVALGEGREGWFDIETRARSHRGERPDNLGSLPAEFDISGSDGPVVLHASIDARSLQWLLRDKGFPVRRSRDAGQFLCEETLYSLERLRDEFSRLKAVVFCHMPPEGTHHSEHGPKFATALTDAVIELTKRG